MTEPSSPTLFHIVGRDEWARAVADGVYRPASLAREGFIHLSTREQVPRTAAKWFAGRDDLVVLSVPLDRIVDAVKWEPVGDELFPHLYAPLDPAVVAAVAPLAAHVPAPFIRLDQLLKREGLASTGGHAKVLIQGGDVQVDGVVETRRGRKLRGGERVVVGEREVVVVVDAD